MPGAQSLLLPFSFLDAFNEYFCALELENALETRPSLLSLQVQLIRTIVKLVFHRGN